MKTFTSLLFTSSTALAAPGYLGVVNKADGTLSLINLSTHEQELVLRAGYLPHEVVSSPDGRIAVASNYGKDHVRSTSGDNRPGNTLRVVELGPNVASRDLDLGEGGPCAPHGVTFSQDGQKLYVTCEDQNEVAVIDMKTERVLHRIPTGQAQSHMLTVNLEETRAFVANFAAGTISVLDLIEKKILKVVPVGRGTEGITLSPDGRHAYATSVLENRIVKIEVATLQIVAEVETDRSPVRVLTTPDGRHVVTGNSAGDTVQVFDAANLNLVKRIRVGRQPIGIVVPTNVRAFVACMKEDLVYEIDLVEGKVLRRIPTGRKPDGLSFIARPRAL